MTNGVEQLVYLFDQAFEGLAWHSVLGNLQTLTPDDWEWVPPGGHRTIRDIVQHIGSCKYMYHDHAFADAQLTWDHPLVRGDDQTTTINAAIAWLNEGHVRLHQSIAALDDSALLDQRPAPWGELKETRWIISTLIQHDLYHTGEINHIHALHQQRDHWGYEEEGSDNAA